MIPPGTPRWQPAPEPEDGFARLSRWLTTVALGGFGVFLLAMVARVVVAAIEGRL